MIGDDISLRHCNCGKEAPLEQAPMNRPHRSEDSGFYGKLNLSEQITDRASKVADGDATIDVGL